MSKTQQIKWSPFSDKHINYIRNALNVGMSVAEGAVRSGKTIDNCIIAAMFLETCPDKYHLATGSTVGNAKLNIGVCNGYGLEALFRGRCRWGKYRDNEAMYIQTKTGEKIVIFAGGSKNNSYKSILGNSYGLWIATEINEHYDSDDSRSSFVKVCMARQLAAKKSMILWDLNPCNPRHKIYSDYIDNYKDNPLASGYQYQKFTLFDNLSIDEDRIKDIISKYVKGSVWYKRDIEGERCVAEGLIYQIFADSPQDFTVNDDYDSKIKFGIIGVDFGGTKSAHTFNFTGFTDKLEEVVVRMEYYKLKQITPDELYNDFCNFVINVQQKFKCTQAFCDNAESTLIKGLQSAVLNRRIPIQVLNAKKTPIKGRISFVLFQMAIGKFKIHESCKETSKAFQAAIYDAKSTEDKRLDDGTINIDSLDSTEYSVEPVMDLIILKNGGIK